jgi:hypothetical protein
MSKFAGKALVSVVLVAMVGMLARLRPHDGRDVAAEPAHVVRFPVG